MTTSDCSWLDSSVVEISSLCDEIDRVRRPIVARWGQIGQDMLDDALGDLWLRVANGKFNREKGSLRGWVRAVLQRRLFSRGRSVRRRRQFQTLVPPDTIDDLATTSAGGLMLNIQDRELAEMYQAHFTPTDIDRVRNWSLSDRIVLLCLSGLWRNVGGKEWTDWTERLAKRREICLPLPSAELCGCETPQHRIRFLAPTLATHRNTLSQTWHRKKHLLEQLDFIRALRA